jgi:hypothetical protein
VAQEGGAIVTLGKKQLAGLMLSRTCVHRMLLLDQIPSGQICNFIASAWLIADLYSKYPKRSSLASRLERGKYLGLGESDCLTAENVK